MRFVPIDLGALTAETAGEALRYGRGGECSRRAAAWGLRLFLILSSVTKNDGLQKGISGFKYGLILRIYMYLC